MIKLCIFDMDGLLVDSERCMWIKSMKQAITEQGFKPDEELHKTFMGTTMDYVLDALSKKYGSKFDTSKLLVRMKQINSEILDKGSLPLMKGARELLDYLKAKKIHTAIGTSTLRKEAERLMKIEGFDKDIETVVCGDEVKHGKPNPEIYLKCFEQFTVSKDEALIFEDGNAGSHAALDAGIRLVIVPDLATLDNEVRSKAYATLDDLSQAIDLIEKENERATSI